MRAEVYKARERAGGVIGVDCREHKLSGQGRVHGYLRRLLVADLADKNNVRILPQNRPETACERVFCLGPHLRLGYSFEMVLDRVLYGDDLYSGVGKFF